MVAHRNVDSAINITTSTGSGFWSHRRVLIGQITISGDSLSSDGGTDTQNRSLSVLIYQLTNGAWGTFRELITLIFIFCLGLSRVSMWRVVVDVDFGEHGMPR